MSSATTTPSAVPSVKFAGPFESLFRISVASYHEMIETGILGTSDRVELLEGVLVKKMPMNPPHVFAEEMLRDLLTALLGVGWFINSEKPVAMPHSEPEPDLAVVRGKRSDYRARKPEASDTGLIVEISDSTLANDRAKLAIYATAGFPLYWIVNIPERRIEVYSDPIGSVYQTQTAYSENQTAPVVLDGQLIGSVPVKEILP